MRKLLRHRPSLGTLLGATALFVALGGTTYAANGGAFILGHANGATRQTRLSAPLNNPAFKVTNKSAGAKAAGIGVTVAPGKAPIVVNAAAGKATNLNADLLDGLDAAAFFRGREVVSNSIAGHASSNVNTIDCPAGKLPVGGGGGAFGAIDTGANTGPRLTASVPTTTGWRVDAHAAVGYAGVWSLFVYAVCAATA
jgi:hypothetical protein